MGFLFLVSTLIESDQQNQNVIFQIQQAVKGQELSGLHFSQSTHVHQLSCQGQPLYINPYNYPDYLRCQVPSYIASVSTFSVIYYSVILFLTSFQGNMSATPLTLSSWRYLKLGESPVLFLA